MPPIGGGGGGGGGAPPVYINAYNGRSYSFMEPTHTCTANLEIFVVKYFHRATKILCTLLMHINMVQGHSCENFKQKKISYKNFKTPDSRYIRCMHTVPGPGGPGGGGGPGGPPIPGLGGPGGGGGGGGAGPPIGGVPIGGGAIGGGAMGGGAGGGTGGPLGARGVRKSKI